MEETSENLSSSLPQEILRTKKGSSPDAKSAKPLLLDVSSPTVRNRCLLLEQLALRHRAGSAGFAYLFDWTEECLRDQGGSPLSSHDD